jgi:hypothetical protein
MNRNLVSIFLLTAALGCADSLDFQATCSRTNPTSFGSCTGSSVSSFSFSGPFLAGGGGFIRFAPGQIPGLMEFGIGTSGGSFTYQGDPCNYDNTTFGHKPCEGEVVFGSSAIVTPSDTGLSLGDVVSVAGLGTARGFFCDPCNGLPDLIFDIQVSAVYQFTLTAPGAAQPFTLTGALVTSVPEPGTWVFASLGLAAVAAALLRPHI